MNVLVTGGGGFIGSHVVDRLLKDGHNVSVIDISRENIERNLGVNEELGRSNLSVHCCDVNSISHLNGLDNIDWIVHLAALADIVPSIENPVDYHDANVNGTLQVLEFARNNNVKRFIYAASSSCYGDKPRVPTQETEPINVKYPYALTKWIGEEYCMHWHKVYKLPVLSLRFFNVYGPRSRTTGAYGAVFGVFLAQKLNEKPYTVVGSGSQSRDFIYVDDVVEAIMSSLKSSRVGEAYNVGSGQHVTINNLVNLLGKNHGIVNLPNRPGEPDITMAWIGKIQQDLKFTTKTTFQAGVKIMLERINDFKDAPLWDKLKIKEATNKWFETLGDNNEH